MTNKDYNLIKLLEKYYGQNVVKDVAFYQPKYGFDMGGNNNTTWIMRLMHLNMLLVVQKCFLILVIWEV